MRYQDVILWIVVFCVGPVFAAQSDEWQWRRIGWEGMQVWSAVSPPDSGDIVYVSICEGADRGVHRSEDGGLTWRFLPESRTYFADMLTINPGNQAEIYCGSWSESDSPGTWPMRSRDAGAHWEEIERPMNRLVPSPWTPGLIFGVQTHYYRYALYRSSDDGANWELLGATTFPRMSENVIFHAEDSAQVFAGWREDGAGWGLGRSNDQGETWEVVLEGGIGGFDEDPVDGNHWVAVVQPMGVGYPGCIAETFDNWNTREKWDLPDTLVWVEQIMFDRHDPSILYLLDNWSTGHAEMDRIDRFGVLRSTDGGQTWEEMNEGLDEPRWILRLVPISGRPGELLAVAYDGLWKWTDQVGIDEDWVEDLPVLRLEDVGPCPFAEAIRGRIVTGAEGEVEGCVYNMGGALVRRLRMSFLGTGTYGFCWDGENNIGSSVPPGAYLFRFDAGFERTSRCVVKIR